MSAPSIQLPPNDSRAPLGFARTYTREELARIRKGYVPGSMDEKWALVFDESWLYFCRSWTGHCVYGVRFREHAGGVETLESWYWTEEAEPSEPGYGRGMVEFLIDTFLLAKRPPLPIPNADPADMGTAIWMHANIGHIPRRVRPAMERLDVGQGDITTLAAREIKRDLESDSHFEAILLVAFNNETEEALVGAVRALAREVE